MRKKKEKTQSLVYDGVPETRHDNALQHAPPYLYMISLSSCLHGQKLPKAHAVQYRGYKFAKMLSQLPKHALDRTCRGSTKRSAAFLCNLLLL